MIATFWLLVAAAATLGAEDLWAFDIDTARSSLEVDVTRAGFLKTFGHDHLIAVREFTGRIQLDAEKPEISSIALRVTASSLQVADKEISDQDRSEVQSTMLSDKVLDVARFPEIVFASTQITRGPNDGEAWNLTVTGTLGLHGVAKGVTFPVILKLVGADLEAAGEVSIRQSDYGIKPVTAGGGLVKVKDVVRIRFMIRAGAIPP